ncbi:unnamed protein product [marine sediment metagenome]|uniref:PD-(D/E)XK endonuclease-like domain-containing protein n=1 Tax=marine sediment metagenome TaxID=412755 RepID=X0ZV44_9ZZZZ
MRINLLTDAPKHNLALMKISAYHKMRGDTVKLNEPITGEGLTYGSWLYRQLYYTDYAGGTSISFSSNGKPQWDYPELKLPPEIQAMKPDYDLYPNNDFSLGYTWSYCPRKCGFCCVPQQCNSKKHHSIWNFHDHRFSRICLLNNNTFSDPQWKETFEEIWDAGLTVCDENGYDLRLLDNEKAEALKRTKFDRQIHFAWDLMEDEVAIQRGLELARNYNLNAMVYVLIGYDKPRSPNGDPYLSDKRQVKAYCLAFLSQYPDLRLPVFAVIHDRDTGSTLWKQQFTMEDREDVADTINRIIGILDGTRQPVPAKNWRKCTRCRFSPHCPKSLVGGVTR